MTGSTRTTDMKSTSKTQRSITSFFGGAVVSTPPKRKTREEHDEEKRAEASSKKVKVAKKKKKRAPKENKKTKKEEEQEQVEEGKEAHVETHEFIEEEKEDEPGVKKEDQNIQVLASEEEQENDDDTPVSVKSTAKPVRRRLRQRIVETDDDESDMEFLMNTKVLDVSSPLSNPENEGEKTEMVDTTRKEGEDEKHRETSVIDTEKKTRKTKSKIETATSKTNDFFLPVANTSATQSVVTVDQKALPSNATAETLDDLPGTLNTQAQDTSYVALANLFAKIEEVSSRLAIQDLLTAFFRDVIRYSPEDLLACTYLCVCVDLAPPFENLKIGIGDAILMKAIGEATGANLKFIKEMYHKEGDLGKVAQNARSKQKTLSFTSLSPASSNGSGLSVKHVYNQFVKIAKMTGNNSQQQKCSIIKGLLVKCEKEKKFQEKDAESAGAAKYIIRGLQGKLRIGLAEKSILMGLTYAFMTEKEYKDKNKQQEALVFVKKAFAECPSYNALIAAFYEVQKDVRSGPFLCVKDFALVASKCVLTPGTPVSPMLARPTKAYAAVFDRFEGKPFTCEYKYDGERAQIHILPNGEIAVFSRNFENSTERFPDVKMAIADAAKKGAVQSCIVDAEVVAVDRATNKRLPFQILSTRSRKNVKVEEIKVPVCIYAFDLLFLNGQSFLSTPLVTRRQKLREIFEVHGGKFEFATSIDLENAVDEKDNSEAMEEAVDKVRSFLEEAVRENCEGLMVKTLEKEATYEPANRSHKWLKLKKDYLDGIGDSVDLVPIGAFYGRGKRTGVYGAYLLACYDPDTEMYQPISKLGTGLSDDVLKKFYDQLKEKVVDKLPNEYAISDGVKPDVWFEASCVWEILGADLSISPKYTAAIGLVAKDKGISLRFPRFIRIRDDKETIHATTSSQIADLYRAQGLTSVNSEDEDDDDEILI